MLAAMPASPVVSRKHGYLSLGEKISDKVSLYGVTGVPQAAKTSTVRQVLEGLGAVEIGGSDTSNTDALSKAADDTIAEGVDYTLGTTTGTKIGTAANQKLAFHGATPVVQRAGSAQALVTATVGAALATTAATQTTPYGFSQAQADGLIARVNALIVDNAALIVLVNELRAAVVAKGLIKGSA